MSPPGGWGVLPYLGMVGRFRGDDPCFGEFQSDWVPILEKIGLYLSHLFPDILGPKVGLVFQQKVSFNRFKAICINFPLI